MQLTDCQKKIKEKSLSEIYPNVVNELINQHLITQQAYKDKLDQQKEIIEILKKNKDQIMAKYWLNNFLANNTSEEKIQDFYTKYLENFKTFKEFNASHILVKEKDEALQIIEKLKIKSEFSKLAKSYSIGPSKKNGGSLGWFRSGQMVKEFEKAVLKLKKGETTKKPVKTKFGYHIIMLNDIRDSQPKKINDIRKQIVNRIKQNSLSNLEKQLRKNKSIKILDFKKVVQEINN
jgi:parvulin-like peptidyl-prolyl isomerase